MAGAPGRNKIFNEEFIYWIPDFSGTTINGNWQMLMSELRI